MKYTKKVNQRNIGKSIETRITVTKNTKNKDLEFKEVNDLYNDISKRSQDSEEYDFELLVVAQNPLQRSWTLKGFKGDELNFEDYDEYFNGKVKDSSKFAKFDRVIFVVKATPKRIKIPVQQNKNKRKTVKAVKNKL
jgi:hypothetical protein